MTADPILLLGLTFGFALLPVMFGLMTAYLKISIVLGMLKQGFGTTQGLGMAVTFALSVVMTFLVMESTFQESLEQSDKIKLADISKANLSQIANELTPIFEPWRQFMTKHAGARELAVITAIRTKVNEKESVTIEKKVESVPFVSVLGAFVLSEIKEACRMALLLLIPFLVIDMIVANVLVGLGMHMVSPTVISLPLKLLIFLSVDGWLLITKSIVASYGGA